MRKTSAAVARLSQSERAGQSAAPGPGVVRMHQGDPDFATPRHILEALNDALEAGFFDGNWQLPQATKAAP